MRQLATIILISLCAVNTSAKGCFDDKNLAELLADTSRGALIYTWSPRMVYSVQNMQAASRAAAAAGLNFVMLHDSRVPVDELPAALQGSQALCAARLIEREALRHFPSAFVVDAGGVHPHAIVGAMPESAWRSSISQRLNLR